MTSVSRNTNEYLSGNYAPVAEEVTAYDLLVVGELPKELNGRYLRNGPNPAAAVDAQTHHWFMGDGMVHGVRLLDGKAEWYRNRYVGSAALSELRGQPDIPGPNWSGNATGPNTNVGGFAGKTWATVEAGGCPVELTYELETVARNDFEGTLPGAFSAHPKSDPLTGELHAMTYAWAQWMDHVQYVVVGGDGLVSKTVDIPLPGMTMIHDISITQSYAVVYDQPVVVDLDLAFAGRFPFRWTPDYGNRVGLLPRTANSAEAIIWIDIPLGASFHPLNAYDTPDGNVIIDICNYDKMFDLDILGPFGDGGQARLERWELHPKTRSINVTVIDETANEFPRHRGSVGNQEHRFGYCAAPSVDPAAGWPTLKHDFKSGGRTVFDHGPGRAAGEPVFVARGGEEDDGWLVTLVHDLGADRADLVVLDAQDFGRGEVARVALPERVPFGFHGNWVSDDSVSPSDS
ncbi:MAG: carotenoid cleavage dioxygenase-like enzyme [Acidimicrobiales bacterium]|jgi:carotenoid cleavage dioxygenase-like enzyme